MNTSDLNATLTYRKACSEDFFVIRIRPDQQELMNFKPGQYVELAVDEQRLTPAADSSGKPRFIRRAYSIASTPGNSNDMEFYVARITDGTLTPRLWELQEGDRLWMGSKIKGKFTLDSVPPQKKLVMVASGTGIAPFVSMLRDNIDCPPWESCTVIHGVRLARDLAYDSELRETAQKNSSVRYIATVTREPTDSSWNGLRGRVQDILTSDSFAELAGFSLSPHNCHVLLCGNPEMIESVQSLLEELGFRLHKTKTPGNIHLERYW